MLKICILHNLRLPLQQISVIAVHKNMITIKRATADDWTTVRKVAETAFPATYSDILSERQIDYMMEWMYSAESLVRQMEEGHVFYIAYDGDGVPVGYVSIQPEGKDVYHLQKLYVLPERQGEGIGRQLFSTAVSEVKRLCPEARRIQLNVNRHNKAYDFYCRMGMRKVDEGDFPIGGGFYMNDYIMGLDL